MKIYNLFTYFICLLCISPSAAQCERNTSSSESIDIDCKSAPTDIKKQCYENLVIFYENRRAADSCDLDAWYHESESLYQLGSYLESYKLCDLVIGNKNFRGEDQLDKFYALQGDCDIAHEKATGERIVAGPGDELPETYQNGLNLYDEAIKLNPKNTRAWNNKGVALAEINNLTGSIYCFERAIEVDPTLAESWNNKGASLDGLDLHSDAIACYSNATALNPYLAEAWYNIARSYNELGMNGAEESYRKGYELDAQLISEAEFRWLYKLIT